MPLWSVSINRLFLAAEDRLIAVDTLFSLVAVAVLALCSCTDFSFLPHPERRNNRMTAARAMGYRTDAFTNFLF